MKNFKRSFALPSEPVSVQDLLRQGLAHHQAERIPEAIKAYERALAGAPNEPDVIHLLGVASLQIGDAARAVGLLERATRLMPHHASAFMNLGNARLANGDFSGATAAYDEAIRLEPGNAEHHYNRANAFLQIGALGDALTGYHIALQLNPNHLKARFNQANALAASGRHTEAIATYLPIAEIEPAFPNLWTNVGISLVELDRLEEAEVAFQTAATYQPDDPQAHNNLGSVLARQKKFEEAMDSLCEATMLAPNDVPTKLNLARVMQNTRNLLAIEVAESAVRLAPDLADAWCAYADALLEFGRSDDAMVAYERALTLDPECQKGNNNLGLALFRVGRCAETILFYDEALTRRPHDHEAWSDRGIAKLHAGDVEGAIADVRRSVELDPTNEYAHSNLVLSHCYSHLHTAEDIRDEAIAWAAVHAPAGIELPPVNVIERDRLRIGYLSADFHAHPAGYLYEAMFPHHDRSRFEIFTYSNKEYYDDVTRRIKASSDHWRMVLGAKDEELAEKIREDGIDILVDLLGHTPGHRLKTFAMRPAPVQATWLGYFGTTGMSQMDFILADQHVLPEAHESHFVERPARMPGCLYVFQIPKLEMPVNALPARAKGHITFGCFNNLSKISEEVVALWCEVMRALPTSRMVMNRWPFSSPSIQEDYWRMFEAHGVDRSRVELRSTKGRQAYFESYHDVDLMLDSFPFGGGTTTSEAFWMGVPVLSLSAERFVGRMTESIAHTVGVPELLPADRSEFVRLALSLAEDLPRLEEYRSTLRAKTEQSPLCDLPRYTRELESTYEWMWANRR